MDMRTSTPIVIIKNSQQSSRSSNVLQPLNPQLYEIAKANPKETSHERLYKIDGPCFIDFQDEIPEARDSFFDGRQSYCPTFTREENERDSLFSGGNCDAIINSLRNWSISQINDVNEDSTLKNSTLKDCEYTLREFRTPNDINQSKNCNIQKRESRQSFTTVKPFSFEVRDRERHERKEAKMQYMMDSTHKKKVESFKAKPAPKFKHSTKANQNTYHSQKRESLDIVKMNNNIHMIDKQKSVVPKTVDPIFRITEKQNLKMPVKLNNKKVTDKQTISNIKGHATIKNNEKQKPLVKITPFDPKVIDKNHIQVEKNIFVPKLKNDHNNHHVKKETQTWKQKPFQVSLSKRKLCIARSPKLQTARRARERQLFDDKVKESERQREESRKIDAAAKEQREKKDIAELRKQLIHKAKPAPTSNSISSSNTKRTLTDPLLPIFVKRRKLNKVNK